MTNSNVFGKFFKELRLRTGKSLRKFCLEYNLDPGNMSKMERGLASPPQSKEKLEEYAHYLGIEENSDDWYNFFDRAAASNGRIPADFMSDKELLMKLPVVFRTLRGQQLSVDNLKSLAELIRRS